MFLFFLFIYFFSLAWKGKVGGNASLCSFGVFIYFRSLLSVQRANLLSCVVWLFLSHGHFLILTGPKFQFVLQHEKLPFKSLFNA